MSDIPPLPQNPVYAVHEGQHTHWTWQCPPPGCGYHTPFLDAERATAEDAYAAHLETCRAAQPTPDTTLEGPA